MKKIISILLVVTAFIPVLSTSALQRAYRTPQNAVSNYSQSKYEQMKDTIKPNIIAVTSSKGTKFNASNNPLRITATTTDNNKVTKLVCYLDGRPVSQVASDKIAVDLDGRNLTTGTHDIKVIACDASGNETSKNLTVNVKPNIKITEKKIS